MYFHRLWYTCFHRREWDESNKTHIVENSHNGSDTEHNCTQVNQNGCTGDTNIQTNSIERNESQRNDSLLSAECSVCFCFLEVREYSNLNMPDQ
jgi:hypothetical protein